MIDLVSIQSPTLQPFGTEVRAVDFTKAFDSADSISGKGRSGLDAFDNTEPAPEYKPLPAGIYTARVISGSLVQTKKGDDAYRVNFEVSEGDLRGRRVSRTWVFSDRALAYTKRDLMEFGILKSQHCLEPFPPLGVEVYCRLTVALQRGDNGDMHNDIKRCEVIRTEDSPAKQFLIDPSSEGAKS